MMIGFDAKRAAQNKTGLGNYSRFIIEALTRFAPNERYLLYIPNPNRTSSLNGIEKANNVELRYPQTTFWKNSAHSGGYGELLPILKKKISVFSRIE